MVQLENNQVKSLKLNYIKLHNAWNHFDCISPVKHLIIIISNHDIKITGDSNIWRKENEKKALKLNSHLCCFIEPPAKWCSRVDGVLEALSLAKAQQQNEVNVRLLQRPSV